ncbi:ESX-1 secretion-associated protein EspF [Mycobacterium lepromatosis]|nr:ESX-1 secretion-associated protein EspF [Mycobacterium lepromatosis]
MTGILSAISSWFQTRGGIQNTISGEVKTPTRTGTGIRHQVLQTSGSHPSQSSSVLTMLKATRNQAGKSIAGVSNSLGSKPTGGRRRPRT